MRRLTVALGTISLGLGMTIVPSPASAADGDFGNSCTASTSTPNATGVMTTKGGTNPLPIKAPSSGVITKATIALPSLSPTPTVLKVMRATGAPNEYVVVAESASFNASSGTQSYPVRVPVTAGDLLGMSGTGVLLCATAEVGDVVASVAGNAAVGSVATYGLTANRAISMVATVEPDADKDGFGDASQDQCPQSAALQTACPTITLDSFAVSQGGSVTVVVTTDNLAGVKVTGTAKVGGKKVKLKGGSQTIKPGALARFKVKIPAKLRTALADLPLNRSIKVSFTATSTDLIGRVSSDKSSVRLPGTG